MADIFAAITCADEEQVDALAAMLERRSQDPTHQRMRAEYLSQARFKMGARVLEVGCGTGVITRFIAENTPGVVEVIGVDPSARMLQHAQSQASGLGIVTFVQADGRHLPFPQASFDGVVFHTTLSHLPNPERALAEAFRVLRPGGVLAVFDGDYSTASVGIDPCDPLQACVDAWRQDYVHDPGLVPRLIALIEASGFTVSEQRQYAYTSDPDPTYLLNVLDRGIGALLRKGTIEEQFAAALRAEANWRVAHGKFVAQLTYVSVIAQKPARAATEEGAAVDAVAVSLS